MSEPQTFSYSVKQDIFQYIKYSADFSGEHYSVLRMLSTFFTPTIMCSTMHRVAHWLHKRKLTFLAKFISRVNFVIHRADISYAAEIGPGLYIPHTVGVVFYGHAGNNLTLYANAQVTSGDISADMTMDHNQVPVFGHEVIVGAYSVVRGALVLGDACFIGAHCLVSDSAEAFTTFFHTERAQVV